MRIRVRRSRTAPHRPPLVGQEQSLELVAPGPDPRHGLGLALVAELSRVRAQDLAHHLAGETQLPADALDRLLVNEIRPADLRDRLHNQHPDLGPMSSMEASVDPQPRGPDWMPITPKLGALFHADPQARRGSATSLVSSSRWR